MPYNKTNWVANETPLSPANMNKIEQGIADAQSTGETGVSNAATAQAAADIVAAAQASHEAEDATTAAKGHVQLTDSISSTSTNTAATPNSVKQAYDKANAAIPKSLATAANDFLVASGVGVFVKKTLAEVKTILGLGTAAYTASTAYATAAQGTLATNALPKAGGTMSGELNHADNLVTRPKLKDYSEVILADTTGTGTQTIDFSAANVHNITQTGAMTFSLTNPPASGTAGSVTIRIKNGETVYAKTFPSSVKWVGDEIPAMDEANKVYDVVLSTFDGGTVYHGACIGPYSA